MYRFEMLKVATFVFLAFVFCLESYAQENDKPAIKVWGIFQPRISYGASEDSTGTANRLGYGIRRARFRVEAMLKNKIGVRYDADFASGAFQTVDVFAFYNARPSITFRLGYMASAQPRAHVFTPVPLIDGIDRAAIAEQWAASTLGGNGRDFGFDVRHQTPAWTIVGFLHNGDGNFARNRGNFSQSISSRSATAGINRGALATSLYLAHRPELVEGLEIGGYVSRNPSKNPNTRSGDSEGRKYNSFAAHVYFGADPGSQPIRGKFDLISVNYLGENEQMQLGISFLSAVRLTGFMEIFGRYERSKMDTGLDAENYWSTGITYSLSKARGGPFPSQRMTLGYSLYETTSSSNQHLLVLQWNLFI